MCHEKILRHVGGLRHAFSQFFSAAPYLMKKSSHVRSEELS